MPTFKLKDDPWENRDVLLESYTPEEIVGRSDEIDKYIKCLEPAIKGNKPKNIFVYGKSGLGKTDVTKFMLNELKKDNEYYDVGQEITTIFLDGDKINTSYRLAVNIVNELREEENQLAKRGKSTDEVYDELWQDIESLGGLLIVVVDEIDHVIGDDDDSILYQLSRAGSNDEIENSELTLIGITNNTTFKDNLSPKVRSSLCEKQIHFTPYEAPDLRNILEARAEKAFKDGALDERIIPKCAKQTIDQTAGDARRALDYLLETGDAAASDGSMEVELEHFEEAEDEVDKNEAKQTVRSLGEEDKLILEICLKMEERGELPASRKEIYEYYADACGEINSDSDVGKNGVTVTRYSYPTFGDMIQHLDMLTILEESEENQGRSGGRFYSYSMNYEPELIHEALDGYFLNHSG